MILEKIEILNYRSIAQTSVVLKKINNSSTYCLLGINESGKSSFLNGVSLFDSDEIDYPQDFFDESQAIKVSFSYKMSQNDVISLRKELIKSFQFSKDLTAQIDISTVTVVVEFLPKVDSKKNQVEDIEFKKVIIKDYTLEGKTPIKIEKGDTTKEELNLRDFFLANLPTHFWSYSHKVLFWESSDKYLINDEIELSAFAADPETISVPLTNCFRLAGIEKKKITECIQKLIKPAPIRNLESVLSERVTEHIKKVWPEHPIEIKFEINNNKISLLIEDEGVKHKAKTTSQRSDGFRQFISFLLTLSAENLNKELAKTVL